MAVIAPQIYLGYEDEVVSEKNANTLSFQVNKIGGLPSWAFENCQYKSKCSQCGLYRLLILQCYAPLDNSQYQRTLYLFACINPSCWNQSEGWECIRSQIPDTSFSTPTCTTTVPVPNIDSNLSWCGGADDWGDDEDTVNGNIMSVDNQQQLANCTESMTENLDTLKSLDQMQCTFNTMKVTDDKVNFVKTNAAPDEVALASIELEDDSGPVLVDSPTSDQLDLRSLLTQNQELEPHLKSLLQDGSICFKAKYISVELDYTRNFNADCDDHVSKLINKYKMDQSDDFEQIENSSLNKSKGNRSSDEEKYEDAIPRHGDKLFHQFCSKIREDPDQILRYSRNSPPLLGAAIDLDKVDFQKLEKCERCNGPRICEVQLMPTFAGTLECEYKLPDLHFLSVLVYTCLNSCWDDSDSLVREMVVFQPEAI